MPHRNGEIAFVSSDGTITDSTGGRLMESTSWLHRWLKRHPLKEPTAIERSRYTAEVMAKVRAQHHPAEAPMAAGSSWIVWPRLALVGAAVTAMLLLVQTHTPSTRQLLVESMPSDDEAWVDQTLRLLDQLDEEAPEDATGQPSDDSWLEELEMLDESELAKGSS